MPIGNKYGYIFNAFSPFTNAKHIMTVTIVNTKYMGNSQMVF